MVFAKQTFSLVSKPFAIGADIWCNSAGVYLFLSSEICFLSCFLSIMDAKVRKKVESLMFKVFKVKVRKIEE